VGRGHASFPAVSSSIRFRTRVRMASRMGRTAATPCPCLRGCGLVRTVAVGRRVRYELADPELAHALADLAALVLPVDTASASEQRQITALVATTRDHRRSER